MEAVLVTWYPGRAKTIKSWQQVIQLVDVLEGHPSPSLPPESFATGIQLVWRGVFSGDPGSTYPEPPAKGTIQWGVEVSSDGKSWEWGVRDFLQGVLSRVVI